MKLRQFTHPWVIALACSLFVQSGALAVKAKTTDTASTSTADKAGALSEQALEKEILVLENRFFFHHYGHDPIEKRLERLELLTLGASQYGNNSERLSHLKSAIVQRDKQAAQIMADHKAEQARIAAKSDGGAKTGAKAETNYPVLSTLEWRILKKTYSGETIDQRLDRLESQLFGMPAQAMSYVDRIERLKKTAGVGSESFSASRFGPGAGFNSGAPVSPGTAGPYTAIRKGPMPRAGSGSGSGSLFGSLTENGSPFAGSPFAGSPFAGSPFENFSEFDEGSLTDRLLPEMPDMQNLTDIGKLREFAARPGGGGFSGQEIHIRIGPDGTTSSVRNFGPDGVTGSTNSFGPADNIFEQLQKPMFEFFKNFGFGPFSGGSSSGSVTPPSSLSPPINDLPNLNKRPTREEIPPYSDPNSI